MNIYRQMYNESTPSADFDKLMSDGTTKKEDWFMDYYLPTKRCQEIINYWCKKHNCNKLERKKIESKIWLGCSPTSVKK